MVFDVLHNTDISDSLMCGRARNSYSLCINNIYRIKHDCFEIHYTAEKQCQKPEVL